MLTENGECAMKKIMFVVIFLLGANVAFAKTELICEAQNLSNKCEISVNETEDGDAVELASCLPPLKPLLPLKPLSCNGTWTQILINCQWVAVCIN